MSEAFFQQVPRMLKKYPFLFVVDHQGDYCYKCRYCDKLVFDEADLKAGHAQSKMHTSRVASGYMKIDYDTARRAHDMATRAHGRFPLADDDAVVQIVQEDLARKDPGAFRDPEFDQAFEEMFLDPRGQVKNKGTSDVIVHDGGTINGDVQYTCDICSGEGKSKVLYGFSQLKGHCESKRHKSRREMYVEEGWYPRFIDCTAKGVAYTMDVVTGWWVRQEEGRRMDPTEMFYKEKGRPQPRPPAPRRERRDRSRSRGRGRRSRVDNEDLYVDEGYAREEAVQYLQYAPVFDPNNHHQPVVYVQDHYAMHPQFQPQPHDFDDDPYNCNPY